MTSIALNLYSRVDCCLCEGLEKRLRDLPLQNLCPPIDLCVIDIDSPSTCDSVRSRYDLEVPVLAFDFKDHNRTVELPRVSPRLKEDGLFDWLQKVLTQTCLL